jgi:hypothetical protein
MINLNIARHFHRAARPAYDPRSRERRIEVEALSSDVSRSADWKPGEAGQVLVAGPRSWIEVRFSGTRIDLVGWRDPRGGSARVWIDGTPTQQAKVFHATYVQPAKGNFIDPESPVMDCRRAVSDRCPHGITLGTHIVPQEWTITMTSDKGDYKLAGSATGFDGNGNAFKPFRSQSGQIIIEPDLWRLANTNRSGDRFTFAVRRSAAGAIDFAGATAKFCERLVENLPPGQHTLRLAAQGDGPVFVDAFDVFEPPLAQSDLAGAAWER